MAIRCRYSPLGINCQHGTVYVRTELIFSGSFGSKSQQCSSAGYLTQWAQADKDKSLTEINAIRSALRTFLSIVSSSISSEGTSKPFFLCSETAPSKFHCRHKIEVVEGQASFAKENLRNVEPREFTTGKASTILLDETRNRLLQGLCSEVLCKMRNVPILRLVLLFFGLPFLFF